MKTLNIATIQSNLIWEDKQANLINFEAKIVEISGKADVVILPELFTTGFSMNTDLAELPDGDTMAWMAAMADKYNMAICGSVMLKNKHNQVFNRLVWMNPGGSYHFYNKRHLFSIAGEHNHFAAGDEKLIINYKGFNILCLVCYDLRFPVWIRRTTKENYDAIVLVANWPQKRVEHWKTLLTARAIENQSYVVAVNRVGHDGKNIYHSGETSFIQPTGKVAYQNSDNEHTAIHVLEKELITSFRQEFAVGNDADDFILL